ncbi:MAG: PAS domain-containing protein, partial [Paraclostridium sp.]
MIGNIAKHILNNMPFPIWIRDLDKKVIFVNNAFENTYSDYEGIESIAKCVCKKCSIKGICDNKIKKLIESNKKQSFEVKIDKMINQCYINPYFDDNKNIVGVIGILIDITDSKQKQKKIEESESILRTIIDTFPDYIFYKDKECKYIGYNKKWEKHYEKLGITSMIGKNDIEIGAISEELARYFVEQDKEIIKTKNPITKEHKAIDENGKVIIQETKKVPVINEHGEILGIVGLSSDVSEKI